MALPVVLFFAVLSASGATADASAATNPYIVWSGDPAVHRAAELLNVSRPMHALQQLQDVILRHPQDPKVLLLAGLAAYRADEVRAALDYWKISLDLAPNEALSRIYEDAQREAAADASNQKLYGVHIALRYDNRSLPLDSARSLLATLDDTYSRVSAQLGCSSDEPVVAIVRSRESYLRVTGAAEWSGGHFDGRVHIAAPPDIAAPDGSGGMEVGSQMQRELTHELVHACLMSIPSGPAPWPAWLQEGLAQKLSGDTLPPWVREHLRKLVATYGIPRLETLGEDWSNMNRQKAVAAYDLALAAADAIYDPHSRYRINEILRNPEILPRITAYLDTKLGL
jgi:hypothetical protein